ncbi:MAG: flagellar biosynthesis protein FlhF, partial [Alcaligenaceae bacterium]|nr:flagellar biosynthesis protein FlhF [Alcaligenaceae bacterium]
MNISRFFGATNREVMRQVRLALGPEALIISNKRVNGGVEILATDQTSAAGSGAADSTDAPPSGAAVRGTRAAGYAPAGPPSD